MATLVEEKIEQLILQKCFLEYSPLVENGT